ncbi:hypothetical protein [Erythrobacter sp. MTPC3]|uniref:spike base protein, RCAP_Rcc01079 family n=1 Tax=Erythrobacter sp. MTPC3 TaxID=3056564 RepID=UPI0036F1A717
MIEDKFPNADSVTSPARSAFSITPDDIEDFNSTTKAIYVGSTGTVVAKLVDDDEDVVFSEVPAGMILDIRAVAIRATGTTATDIIGLR